MQNFNQNDNNRAILTISQIIKNIMASASEAKCAALFINTRVVIVVRTTLRGNRTSETGQTNASGKINLRWHNELQNTTKMTQGNRNAFLLGER